MSDKMGPYADALRLMQASGGDYLQIWHLFAFKPRATDHLARCSQSITADDMGPLHAVGWDDHVQRSANVRYVRK